MQPSTESLNSIDGKAFQSFIKRRRSTRIFKEYPIDRDVIMRIIGAATEAPTACNRQLWHTVVVTDPLMKRKISSLSHAEQSYIYDAYALICVFYDCTLEDRNPCNTPFIGAGMALYAMLLAAEAEDIGAIYLGGIRKPAGVSDAVGAPSYLKNVGIICIGHKDDTPPAPNHRPPEHIIDWERCSLPEKRFHADIRPHLWNWRQIADFREKLLWYKGVHIDGATLHVDPDNRYSPMYQYMTKRLGMMIQKVEAPIVLDLLALNGALILQLLNACGPQLKTLYAYEQTEGITTFMRQFFMTLCPSTEPIEYLVNASETEPAIPLQNNQIDIMSCYERLEHFHDPLPLLKEMHRVLKPDGKLLVIVSNRLYPHLYRYRRMRKKNYALGRNWNRGPEKKYNPAEIRTYFEQAGFTILQCEGLNPLSSRILNMAARLLRRFKQNRVADHWNDLANQGYISRNRFKTFSSAHAYELTKK
jgi:nitroreductase/ubiquinone/menaquinone biosynthesis C-methylase UbiE